MAETAYPIFPGVGVLSKTDDPTSARLVSHVSSTSNPEKIIVLNDVGMTEEFPAESITVDPENGKLRFVSDGTTYTVRIPRETDGVWLSKYRTDIPFAAFRAFAAQGENKVNPEETLEAYATDDSPYIVGLVYGNTMGRWARIDEDWVLISPTDTTYDDLNAYQIDSDRADEFISLYDSNYVSVTDAERYESADSTLLTPEVEAETTSDE